MTMQFVVEYLSIVLISVFEDDWLIQGNTPHYECLEWDVDVLLHLVVVGLNERFLTREVLWEDGACLGDGDCMGC